MMAERRCPTCKGLATFGPPKSRTMGPAAWFSAPSFGSAATLLAIAAKLASLQVRLINPGPANSTDLKIGWVRKCAATASAACLGFNPTALDAGFAPLH